MKLLSKSAAREHEAITAALLAAHARGRSRRNRPAPAQTAAGAIVLRNYFLPVTTP